MLPELFVVLRNNFHAFDACEFFLYFYSWYFISLTTKYAFSLITDSDVRGDFICRN